MWNRKWGVGGGEGVKLGGCESVSEEGDLLTGELEERRNVKMRM